MALEFTVHCIPWHAGALLIEQFRRSQPASELPDSTDAIDLKARHAIALDNFGFPLGSARLTPAGTIDRIVVRDCAEKSKIAAALQELLKDQQAQGWCQ